MNGYNILIVEDEVSVSKGLKKVLEGEGANVSVNETGEGVVEQLADAHLILMDIMLPFDDGLSISKEILHRVDIPIIFLTAMNDIDSKLDGLKSGEDYITKPFHPLELISRLNNVISRHYGNEISKVDHLSIDEKNFTVFNEEMREISFTRTERKIFFYLYKNINMTLSKDQIIEYTWPDGDVFDNIVSVYIKKIRKKVNDAHGELIKTINGIGYRMEFHE
ncbi:response regulator transcription factor [Salinicoccus halodurans]|uniref:DNA-binding response regulator, OmpR family, contains REC and winged-helix (WHTH) domain n=1 Tax=Salinicoccus halodurans TaxID=407035 RepID=A0A0F7HK93_9STAP|nr:response regulator transcription factor [Salinicoccus halodurans]AKG73903.1 hypothetical protein AAT16_06455 [Salinicoccus halodurans]SFK57509.1 DNA-binding response regulator, OmpR family, contains REC and winged-helix (wHTH) domain [Salinicoccus halodurans]